MPHLYRPFSNRVRSINEQISKIERKIVELDYNISEIKAQLVPQNRLKCAEELINRLERWIELDSRQILDVDEIRDDLQAQLADNDKLPSVDTEPDDALGSAERRQRMLEFSVRKEFIRRTFEDVSKNEAKLRCVRAAMTIFEDEINGREEYQDRLEHEIEALLQEVNEPNGQLQKEVRLKIIEQQHVHLAEELKTCQRSRSALLSEERKCLGEIASDLLAIEKMEEFNAKSIRNLRVERMDDDPFCTEKRTILQRCLKLLDQSVEEWREYLDALQLHRQKVWCRVEGSDGLFKLQRERRNHWQKTLQLQDERIALHAGFVKAHEQFLGEEVDTQIVLNKRLILECEADRRRRLGEEEAVPKTSD